MKILKREFVTGDKYLLSFFLIYLPNRLVITIPSQLGCVNSCSFCVSKDVKFRRNLRHEEFLRFLELVEQEISESKKQGIEIELSFTGEGEPLYNIKEINKVLTDKWVLGLVNYFKISFSGRGSKIIEKIENKNSVVLQFSMHEVEESIRNEYIPRTDDFKVIKNNLKEFGKDFKLIQINYLNGFSLTEDKIENLKSWVLLGVGKISLNSLMSTNESFCLGIDQNIGALLSQRLGIEVVYSQKVAKKIMDNNFYSEMTFKKLN